MGIKTGASSTARLIDKYINTSYDKVVAVFNNLTDINTVADANADITSLAAQDLATINTNVQAFGNVYYGDYVTEAALTAALGSNRPDGSARQAGDLYYNSGNGNMFAWDGSAWETIGSFFNQIERQTATAGQQSVGFSSITYEVGANNLQVYVNGVFQTSSPAASPNTRDYDETNSSNIFFNEALQAGDEITAIAGVFVSNVDVSVDTIVDNYTATAGQTSLGLITSYSPGNNALQVFINGVYQQAGVHYLESSATSITFQSPLDAGDYIVVITGVVVSNVESAVQTDREEFTIANNTTTDLTLTTLTYVPGNNNLQIFVNGVKQNFGTAYTEDVDEKSIHFTEALDTGDVVEALVGSVVSNYPVPSVVTSYEVQTATANQTVFNLTLFSYNPGTGDLSIYVNGVRMMPDYQNAGSHDYAETNSSTVTFDSGLLAGDIVQFVIGEVFSSTIGSGAISYQSSATGASSRSLTAKLGDIVSVKDFGAIDDNAVTDSTAAIQAAIDSFKNPSESSLPGNTGFLDRAFKGRVLDLAGGIYGISSALDFTDAHGLTLQNGTLIAIGTWTDDHMLTADATIAANIHNITLEAQQKTNGILLNRAVYNNLTNINIWGIGDQEFGFKGSTAFAGQLLKLDKVNVYGMTAAETGTNTPTATGFLLANGADSVMTNCETNRVLVGVDITQGGWRVDNCHFTSYSGAATAGVILQNSSQYVTITNCDFDHTYLHLKGTARWYVTNNYFRNTVSEEQEYAVYWEATAANQARNKVRIRDNHCNLTGATPANYEFIRDYEPGGFNWDNHDQIDIGNNLINQQSAIPTGLIVPRATNDSVTITTATANWEGQALEVDMSAYLFNATPPVSEPPFTLTGCIANGANLIGYAYNHRTGYLHLGFDDIFVGDFDISYRYGHLTEVLSAQAYGTNLFSAPQDFSNGTYWTLSSATITANSTADPAGATTADTLVETAVTAVHRVSQSYTKAASELTYLYTVYAKQSTRTALEIRFRGTGASDYSSVKVDLTDGTINSEVTAGTFSGHAWDVQIMYAGNDWYQIICTGLSDNHTALIVEHYLLDGAFANNYAGDGTSGVFLWDARLEAVV